MKKYNIEYSLDAKQDLIEIKKLKANTTQLKAGNYLIIICFYDIK